MTDSSFVAWTETTLGGIWLLQGVPEDTVLELGTRSTWRRYPVGQRLPVGAPTQRLFFLTRGTVQVRVPTTPKPFEYGPGATVGLLSAFAKTYRNAEVQATTPVTVGWLGRDDICDVMTRCGELAIAVARALAIRSRAPAPAPDDRHVLDHRVAMALVVAGARYTRPDGAARLPSLPDHALWAALLGVNEADVRRSFSRLERAGLIRPLAAERLHVDVPGLKARLAAAPTRDLRRPSGA